MHQPDAEEFLCKSPLAASGRWLTFCALQLKLHRKQAVVSEELFPPAGPSQRQEEEEEEEGCKATAGVLQNELPELQRWLC